MPKRSVTLLRNTHLNNLQELAELQATLDAAGRGVRLEYVLAVPAARYGEFKAELQALDAAHGTADDTPAPWVDEMRWTTGDVKDPDNPPRQPVRRVQIPKPDGRKRMLGIPTVLDRCVQQAIAQIVQARWEPHFHPDSYGFRPQRSAHQAVRKLQGDVKDGHGWVVDLDLESFFDRVNHDRLLHRLRQHVDDRALLRLITAFLKAGAWVDGHRQPGVMGVPQGGPLSPVLANVMLDVMDWELCRRGHRFARYADDCNIAVKSECAGKRVMHSVTRWIEDSLRLTVNSRKSAVDRPWNRKFLGFTLSRRDRSLKVADTAIDKLEDRVRELSRRTRGQSLSQIVAELRQTLLGWKAYFGVTEVLSPLRELDKWIQRRLRCYAWKQWGTRGYRELRRRGVSVREAWNVSKSAHGPWRISKSPALSLAMPTSFFSAMGLPELAPARA